MESLKLEGDETFDLELADEIKPQHDVTLVITRADGSARRCR